MINLESVKLVQFYLFEKEELRLDNITGIFGPNGSGKSSFLDAVQIAMVGANGRLVALNAQADDKKSTRSIRSYCLGQYGDMAEQRARDNALTYITLLWRNTVTNEPISMGVCIYASADREGHEVLGRYILPGVELSVSDHVDASDGVEKPREWSTFRHQLIEKAKVSGEDPLYPDHQRYIRAAMLALRGAGGPPAMDAFLRAFGFCLKMKFEKSVDQMVRDDVLESKPTNIKRFKEVTESFRRLSQVVAKIEKQILDGEAVDAEYTKAAAQSRRAVTWNSIISGIHLEKANEAEATLSTERENHEERLDKAIQEQLENETNLRHAREEARRLHKLCEAHSEHIKNGVLQEKLKAEQETIRGKRGELKEVLQSVGVTVQSVGQSPLMSGFEGKLSDKATPLLAAAERVDSLAREEMISSLNPALKTANSALTYIFNQSTQVQRDIEQALKEQKSLKDAIDRSAKGKAQLSENTQTLLTELKDRGLNPIPVCDLVKITDRNWQPVIESYLGPHLEALLVPEHEEKQAFEIYRGLRGPRAVYGAKIAMESIYKNTSNPQAGTVAELIDGEQPAAIAYLRSKLGNTLKAVNDEEAMSGKRALTQDGMLVGNGEIDRLRPVSIERLKIGALHSSHNDDLRGRVIDCDRRISKLENRHADYVKLAQSLQLISNSVGLLRSATDIFDQMESAVQTLALISSQLSATAANEEYSRLFKKETDLLEVAALHEGRIKPLSEAVGLAEAELKVAKLKEAQASAEAEDAYKAYAESRQNPEYESDFALTQWDSLVAKFGDDYTGMLEHCESNKDTAIKRRDDYSRIGTGMLGTFLGDIREQISQEVLGDWRKAKEWITELLTKLRDTELVEHKAKMDDAYRTSQETFRNDVAIAISNNLDWLNSTLDKLNDVLRTCPTFSNGERYHFKKTVRPQYDALLKFVKDIAAYGPTDDLLGGAGEMPLQFRELLEDKIAPETSSLRNPLDDYREFYEFDIEILREDPVTKERKLVGRLSKRVGSGSGGEHRAPLYVIAGAALASAYRLDKQNNDGIRLIMLDEAFTKMDHTNTIATMQYLQDLGLQVFLATPFGHLATLTAFLDSYYNIIRDSIQNVVLLSRQKVSLATRKIFQEDLQEFNPDIVDQELAAMQAEKTANLLVD